MGKDRSSLGFLIPLLVWIEPTTGKDRVQTRYR